MPKVIHFHESIETASENTIYDFKTTSFLIHHLTTSEQTDRELHTTQMVLLNKAGNLLESGCRILIHEPDGETYELKLGNKMDSSRCQKHLRKEHNFLKLWLAGAFRRQ